MGCQAGSISSLTLNESLLSCFFSYVPVFFLIIPDVFLDVFFLGVGSFGFA